MQKAVAAVAFSAAAFGLVGCSDAEVASSNLSKQADNFEISRNIVFFNGITDKYLLQIKGYCSVEPDTAAQKLDVTCKVPGGFKKHFLGLSDNVSYFVEQVDPGTVSTDFYEVNFKPSVIIPDFEVR
ncbi:hypothetical protein ASE48_08595 [Mycobacterium sp. Root265]|nr:hypothetical protein ASE48_08595 [Mycobacterium sp. Root265]